MNYKNVRQVLLLDKKKNKTRGKQKANIKTLARGGNRWRTPLAPQSDV